MIKIHYVRGISQTAVGTRSAALQVIHELHQPPPAFVYSVDHLLTAFGLSLVRSTIIIRETCLATSGHSVVLLVERSDRLYDLTLTAPLHRI
jgi:hypothetical protein